MPPLIPSSILYWTKQLTELIELTAAKTVRAQHLCQRNASCNNEMKLDNNKSSNEIVVKFYNKRQSACEST